MANKENRGWIKPTEFNMLAKRAQLDVLKDRVGLPSPDGIINGYKDNAQLMDELRPVIVKDASMTESGGTYSFPADYLYFLGLRFNDEEVDMVRLSDLNSRRKSQLNTPSPKFPIAAIFESGLRVYTNQFGGQVGDARLSYIKSPTTPRWAHTTVNNIELYNSNNSADLTLPESTHKEIAHRILAYIGVELREATIVEYGTSTVLEQNK